MTPFQVFRRWCRRAPLAQKVASATAAAAVMSVLIWAIVPAGGTPSGSGFSSFGGSGAGRGVAGSSAATVGGTGASTAGSGATGGAAAGSGAQGAAVGAASGQAGTSSGGGHCLAGTTTGVTSTQIKIAILLTNVAGAAGNSTFGIASPQAQQGAFQGVINSINASGGVACRKLVPQFYTENPIDQSSLQQLCVTLAQSGVFAVLDTGSFANYPVGINCIAQNHIPYFGGYMLSEAQIQQFYPYLFDLDMLDTAYRNEIFAFHQLGYFSPSNGFTKLGIIYRDCFPALFPEETSWLAQVGVPSSDIVSYDMGCPQAFASPSDIENAIVKFQQNGVKDVTEIFELGDFATFTNTAQSQGYDPKYLLGDDGLLEISSGTQAPNPNNINNAVAITTLRDGEENTAGLTPTAGTQKCNSEVAASGLSPVWNQPGAVGNACDQLWMFQAALDHAPALSTAALAVGLERAGSVDFSYPQGPSSFAAANRTTGGQFWRVDQFTTACNCWRVTEPNFNPGF